MNASYCFWIHKICIIDKHHIYCCSIINYAKRYKWGNKLILHVIVLYLSSSSYFVIILYESFLVKLNDAKILHILCWMAFSKISFENTLKYFCIQFNETLKLFRHFIWDWVIGISFSNDTFFFKLFRYGFLNILLLIC